MDRWMVTGVIFSLLLAGCAAQDETSTGDASVNVVTDPNDRSALNQSGFHLHDYWGGQDSLYILDQTKTLSWAVNGGQPLRLDFTPEDGTVIPLGTASIDVTVSWTYNRDSLHGDTELWIKDAANDTSRYVATIDNGDTVTVQTTNNMSDLPHQVLSAWVFDFAIHPYPTTQGNPVIPGAKSVEMEVTMDVVAHRGLEIPLFPPHPDHWQNETRIALVEDAEGTTLFWGREPPDCGYCSGGLYEVVPRENIVPYDADFVRVEFDYEHTTPTGLNLLYHGATSREWTELTPESDDGETKTYLIDVGPDGDGPYAKSSLWRFYFGFNGTGPYSGGWSLSAWAEREAQQP